MSKWIVSAPNPMTIKTMDGVAIASVSSPYRSKKIVREHNAHDDLVTCLTAYLKITCGDCRGNSAVCDNRGQDGMHCALAEQARTAIAAAKGGE